MYSGSLLHCIVLTVVIYNARMHNTIANVTCWRIVILGYRWNKNLLIIQEAHCGRSSTLKNHLLSVLTSMLFASAVYFGRQFQNFTSPVSNFLLLKIYWWTADTPCMCASIVLWLNSNFPPCSDLVDRVLSGFCMVRNEESGQSVLMRTKSHMKGIWYFGQLFKFYIVFIYFVLAASL